MQQLINNFISKNQLSDSSILVALSGGVDSTVLLYLLADAAKSYNLTLHALHVNHLLRGTESKKDAIFCKTICKQLKIKLKIINKDIGKLSQLKKTSLELTARDFRKQSLTKYVKLKHCSHIFLAHTKDDQIETIIFRIARGTGLNGLTGIKEVTSENKIGICRPLLQITKQKIIKFAVNNSIKWREDLSNQEKNFTRNQIRHNIIPEFYQIFGNSFSNSVVRLSEISSLFLDEFKKMIPEKAKDSFIIYNKNIFIELKGLLNIGFIAFSELLRDALIKSSLNNYLPDLKATKKIYNFSFHKTGKTTTIQNNIIINKDRGFLHLFLSNDKKEIFFNSRTSLIKNGKTILKHPEASQEFYLNFIKSHNFYAQYAFDKNINLQKVKLQFLKKTDNLNSLRLQNKTLKKLFSEKKTPNFIQYNIPCLFYNKKLILIPGIAGDSRLIKDKGPTIKIYFKTKEPYLL